MSKTFFTYLICIFIKICTQVQLIYKLCQNIKKIHQKCHKQDSVHSLMKQQGKLKHYSPSQPTDSCATPDPITRRKTKQGLSPSTAKYPTLLPDCCKDTSGTKILNSETFNKVLNQHCGFEHSNPMLTFQLMDHQIKCGCKISSSEDTVKTTIF